ncbi:hypothetical protein D3C85_1639350 [compost metagenome]
MVAHDRSVEQCIVGPLGGDVEVGGCVGRLEVDGQYLACLRTDAVLRGSRTFDRLVELDAIGAFIERDLLDTRPELGGGVCKRGNHGQQNGVDPAFHGLFLKGPGVKG